MAVRLLQRGEPAPSFEARSPINPRFRFDTVAGRYVVLCFFGSAGVPSSRRVIDDLRRHQALFDDDRVSLFAVCNDPEDERLGRVTETLPGFHVFWDFDGKVARLYRAADPEPAELPSGANMRRFSLVLDERLRVLGSIPFGDDPETHVARLIRFLSRLPAPAPSVPGGVPAPVLVVPRIFEPQLCQALMRYYQDGESFESGFMREVDGRTVAVHDASHKKRRDREIADPELRAACMTRIHDRLAPEIFKAFQFRATRIERYIVACYDASSGGYFRPHRDNTTRGTAHRKFAVSLNLNTGEFEGGNLRFPEFGRQTYAPPAGGAVVFSCSLLHEATPVTAGKRYAFLPFLYDEEAARVRRQNLQYLGPGAPGEGTAATPG